MDEVIQSVGSPWFSILGKSSGAHFNQGDSHPLINIHQRSPELQSEAQPPLRQVEEVEEAEAEEGVEAEVPSRVFQQPKWRFPEIGVPLNHPFELGDPIYGNPTC